MGMNLTTARLWVRQFARNAGDSSVYSDTDIDRAIYTVGERFARMTRCVRTASSVDLTADDATVDFSGVTGFLPEQIISAYVLTEANAVAVVKWEDLYQKQINTPTGNDPCQRRELAFETPTIANIWPAPTEDGTLRVRWWETFTTWTLGVADGTSTTFNLPDQYLTEILTYGAPACLQHNSEEHGYMGESWKKYLEFEQRMMGAGNLGARSARRAMIM